jgi:tetratricopeptide (TPR) repeat protein
MLARAFLLIALLGIFPHPSARAQQPAPAPAAAPVDYESLDLQGLFDKAGELMESANWEEALIPLNLLVKDYGKDAMTDYGPTFGVMYYRRGFCLKNLKRFDEALADYETCYKQFPNTPSTPSGKTNPVFELARLEMGIIKLATGKYEDALVDFEAFAAAPAPAGTYDETAFRIQAAACYTKAGKTERGHQLIEQLFQPTTPGATAPRPDALMRALLTLVDDWTSSTSPDAEKQAHQFIDQYGTQFSVPAFDMKRFEFNNRIVALARKASDNNQTSLAIRLIGLMASPSDILDDLQTRAQRTAPNVPEALQKEITNATAQLTDPDNLHWIAQLSLAGAYERSGNPATAFAIYQRCLEQVPASPNRDLILFGAMRAALALGHMEFAQSLGDAFRKEFASSQYATNVNTMQLESLYFTQRYQEALDLANSLRSSLKEKSTDRDLADFVVAASLFHLDHTREAIPELLNHAQTYPDSRFKEHVRYFAASANQKLKEWQAAGTLLDAFIKDFPTSQFLPFALLDRGSCYFQLGDHPKALDTLGDLQKQFTDFVNLDAAIAMRGDAHLMLNNNDQAEAAYLKALELATSAGPDHAPTQARVLVQLVRVSNTLEKNDAILQHYDLYMKNHVGSSYDADIIVSSLAALTEVKRGSEALNALEKVIIRLGSSNDGTGVEEAIGSYAENAIQVSGPEALLDKLQNFVPERTQVNNTLRAWLIMARIDLLEKDEYKDKFPKRAAQIQVAFEELRTFDKKELAPYILVQVGRNLANQNKPETNALALEWFNAVLDRGTSDHSPLALMGKARILASSGEPSVFDDAIDAFDKVIRDLKDKPEYVEEAMLAKGRLYYGKQKWKEASQVLFDMQSNSSFTRNRPEVFAKLARSYEEQGKLKEALEAYTPFIAPPFENYVDYSAEARVRAAEIVLKQGDKAKAFRLIKDTVSRMYKQAKHPVAGPYIERAKELYKKLKVETQAKDEPDEGIWGVR